MLLSVMLAAGLSSGPQAPSDEPRTTSLRVRSLDASIRATIDEGCRRSPAFAELVERIERSDRFVYVELVRSLRHGMKGGTAARWRRLAVSAKRRQLVEREIQVEELERARIDASQAVIPDHFDPRARPLRGAVAARMIDEDAPHHLRGEAVKMRPALPHHALLSNQPEVGFADRRGWLQRVVPALATEVRRRLTAQLSVHNGKQRIARPGLAALPRSQQTRHAVHNDTATSTG